MRRCVLFLFFVSALGCDSVGSVVIKPVPGKVNVVATTSIVADLVRQIGGEHVHVTAIMPPGIDPHRYTPLPADTTRLAQADLVFFNGLHLEGKMVDVLEKANINGRKPVAVTKSIPVSLLHKGDGETEYDPHVWFDVSLWAQTIDVVRDSLIDADPAHAETYRANAELYRKQLKLLHEEVLTATAKLPIDLRVLVTSHDAFGYFAKAYGFEVHGLQGVSTASEIGIEDRRALSQLLIAKSVPAVFAETSVPTKGLLSVLDSVKSKTGRSIRMVGGSDALYSDSLGTTGTPGETYVGMVRHNIAVIVRALSP